jgi:predicted nucleotidyltransferase
MHFRILWRRIKITAVSIVGAILIVVSVLRAIIDWLGEADFLSQHLRESLRDATMSASYVPSFAWSILLPVSGVCLIWWDIRNQSQNQFAAYAKSLERLSENERTYAIEKWLANSFSDKRLSIKRAYLFGSIVHDHYQTSDVDLVAEFLALKDSRIRRNVRDVKDVIAKDFFNTFGHPLHVTFFCSDEDEQRRAFLLKAGRTKSIIGVP